MEAHSLVGASYVTAQSCPANPNNDIMSRTCVLNGGMFNVLLYQGT